ncbi:polyprenyl synthetase family protein [Nocardia colli]|uniref:Polyprenyl synthetase family protein n=1 Tax=Nocardia colli TaxID=2545717 RepID=A0A5N0EKN2_9NOCA|nr:polyprenyl synthetase family protein [Nocardia colli]KAA8889446.1 polyprenyl synthetase family protein [Nocardia colli]
MSSRDTAVQPPPLPDTVHRSREMLRAGMESALAPIHPDLALACRYYFGWRELDGTPVQARGSRGLQASVAFLCARAVGGQPESALPAAIAMEFLHNSSLLHDDLMDEDAVRRDRPTVWAALGTPTSLLSGNALWIAANEVLLSVPGELGAVATRLLNESLHTLTNALAAEMNFERRPAVEIALDEWPQLGFGKGGALLGCGAGLGVRLGGGSAAAAEPFEQAARHAGLAWQAMNDVENIWGDADLIGKPGYNDLRQRKRTLPVLAALHAAHPDTAQLSRLWDSAGNSDAELAAMATLIELTGGRGYAEGIARSHLSYALGLLGQTPMPAPVRTELRTMLHFVVTRDPHPPD